MRHASSISHCSGLLRQEKTPPPRAVLPQITSSSLTCFFGYTSLSVISTPKFSNRYVLSPNHPERHPTFPSCPVPYQGRRLRDCDSTESLLASLAPSLNSPDLSCHPNYVIIHSCRNFSFSLLTFLSFLLRHAVYQTSN